MCFACHVIHMYVLMLITFVLLCFFPKVARGEDIMQYTKLFA